MPAARRATSLTLDAAMLDEAKSLGVNISRAAEVGLAAELKKARTEAVGSVTNAARRLQRRTAISTEFGIPLADLRKF